MQWYWFCLYVGIGTGDGWCFFVFWPLGYFRFWYVSRATQNAHLHAPDLPNTLPNDVTEGPGHKEFSNPEKCKETIASAALPWAVGPN